MVYRRILATGPILNGRDEYLNRVVKVIEEKGFKVRIYRVFEYMQHAGKYMSLPNITRENILDLPVETLRQLRLEAMMEIDKEIESSRDVDIHIISTPNVFHIKPHGTLLSPIMEGLEPIHVTRYVKPDLILVMIDDLIKVVRRCRMDEVWSRRFPNVTLEDVARWRHESIRNIEAIVREIYREREEHRIFSGYGEEEGERGSAEHGIGYIQFSVNHDPEVLAELIIGWKPRIYLSYNMTGMPPESFENIRRLYRKLLRYFVVFDPGTIKDWELIDKYEEAIEKGEEYIEFNGERINIKDIAIEKAIDLARAQLVSRDFNLVRNSHAIAVYHHGRYPSYGVMAEVMEASRNGIPIYVLYPYNKRLSPFFEQFAHSSFGPRMVWKRIYPDKDNEELEDIFIDRMVRDVCKGLWPTWSITDKYREEICSSLS